MVAKKKEAVSEADRDAVQHARTETQNARVEAQSARNEAQGARNEAQGERNRAQTVATEAQGAQNTSDIGSLGIAVGELISSNRRNEEGIATVATLLRESALDRRNGRIMAGIVVLFLSMVGALLYADLREARIQSHDILHISEANNKLLKQIETVIADVGDATSPDGCSFQRMEALRAEAVRKIQNDNRVIHKLEPIPADPAVIRLITEPCPGEKSNG